MLLQLRRKLAALEEIEEVNWEDLGLDFTVPGYDIELKVGARVIDDVSYSHMLP